MGDWGNLPWDNDSAADWFGDLFDETKLANRVEATLKLDAKDSPEEVRAAAAMVLLLGHTYVWPIDKLDEHLTLAADRLEEILKLGIYSEAPDLEETMRLEIQELRGRIKDPASAAQEHPKSAERKWWKFW
ncbi:hypothetical protein [Roseimicrobium sp. ORNL1]|uniref:hypothetical protein n=1 Tax=Roseimicrobium sp. ORNL1 TaxID=2711231 RepID=UPI0019823AC2|nr:hypothetical protein [Roseimicrobium sp. ORNL1]